LTGEGGTAVDMMTMSRTERKSAEQRRQSIEHQKQEKAHQDVVHSKDVARRVRSEKENSPAPSPVKGQ